MAGRSTFGTVRTLSSGKHQARYLVDGKQVSAGTFKSKREAWASLARVQVEMDSGTWVDPALGKVNFRDHAAAVLEHRQGDLKDSTLVTYRQGLRTLVFPTFGSKALADITVQDVDRWWSSHQHVAPARKNAYMTMRMVFRYAIRWGLVESSPCMVEDAGKDTSKPRPEFTVADFKAILAQSDLDQGALLWTIFGGHLRIAEAAGLNRSDWHPEDGTLSVVRQYAAHGPRKLTTTKTGVQRRVKLLRPAREALEAYLADNPGHPWDAMFTGERGERMSTDTIRKKWNAARSAAGMDAMHVHDLRHISLTLVARSGATLKDVMARGGHTTPDAALRYQHSGAEQDALVAAATDQLLNN